MGFFSPDGKNAVEERPVAVDPALNEGWCRDVSHPGAGDGTEITASFLNQLIGNLRRFVTGLGGTADGSDTMLLGAIQNGLSGFLSKAVYDPYNVGGDAFDMGKMVEAADAKILTPAERDKLALIAIASGIDLDELQQRVIELDAAIVLKGEWDASSGVFPGGGATEPGWSYVVTVAGTVDGVEFSVNDRLLALEANAPEDSYAGYWLKLDYSDLVTSIEGQTGLLSLADIGAAPTDSPAFTGTPTAPTPEIGDNSTRLATTAYVRNEVEEGRPRIGVYFHWPAETPPDGALVRDGSAIPVATYPELAAIIYCGDENNATVDWGYRTTSQALPSGNRSTTGEYIVLPRSTGRFTRNLDTVGPFDILRNLWRYQNDAAPNIYGNFRIRGGPSAVGVVVGAEEAFSKSDFGSTGGLPYSGSNESIQRIQFQASHSNGKFGAAGEIRPVNEAALPCIWYE